MRFIYLHFFRSFKCIIKTFLVTDIGTGVDRQRTCGRRPTYVGCNVLDAAISTLTANAVQKITILPVPFVYIPAINRRQNLKQGSSLV